MARVFGPYPAPTVDDEVRLWSSMFAGTWRVRGRTLVVDRANGRVLERLDVAMADHPRVDGVLWLDVSDRAMPGAPAGVTYRQRVAPAGQVTAPPVDHSASLTLSLLALGGLVALAYLSRPDSPAERRARMGRIEQRYPAG